MILVTPKLCHMILSLALCRFLLVQFFVHVFARLAADIAKCNCVSVYSEPLNNGHVNGRTLVHCREVVPISEVD